MTGKIDIKKLLREGLTGKEAGKLIIQDNWLVDRGKEGFLSERDVSSIRAGIKTYQDMEDFNSYVDLYRLVDYTLKDARIRALEAEYFLQQAARWISERIEKEINTQLMMYIPAIVTQKQYEELSKKQRESLLKEPHILGEVIRQRVYELGDLKLVVEEDFILEEDFKGEHPELWRDAVSQILELVRAGKLKPILLEDKEDYYNYKDKHFQPAGDITGLLERLLEGTLSQEEEDKFLEKTAFLGAELYEAGLPEHIQWIDEYKPDLDEETAARPKDMMQSINVAIIQHPRPEDIDERGYWKEKDWPAWKHEVLDAERVAGLAQLTTTAAADRIKLFLSIHGVLDAISKIVDIDFSEDLREWYEEIEENIKLYNINIKYLMTLPINLEPYEGLKPLKLGKLKPTASSIRYYRERMAMALGGDWWKEAIHSLEYEDGEPGSLAQEIATELAEDRAKAKEEKDD